MIRDRQSLEQLEDASLAAYAVRAGASRGRLYPEGESERRTAFQRDRDRVVHTGAFRRLEAKTQVFIDGTGDNYRTRLTHTLEVVQVARSIARALGLNEDLTETIALAHDLGHPPFGHTGEDALQAVMADFGGFEHNRQTYRVVTLLEGHDADHPGLNLSWETLEGLVKHERDVSPPELALFEPAWKPSLEASLADVADAIAYTAHDLDDGLRSGLIRSAELEDLGLWRRVTEPLRADSKTGFDRRVVVRELLGLLVSDVIESSAKRLERHGIDSLAAVRNAGVRLIAPSDGLALQLRGLKAFLYANLYRHPNVVAQRQRAERVLEQLFVRYTSQPSSLPLAVQTRFDSVGCERAVCDYLAGMTDRFAMQEARRLFESLFA